MLTAKRAERQWKRAADAALSTKELAGERGRLSAELARRVWAANGGQISADVHTEPALLSLEALILPSLDDAAVRASAALRFLQALETGVRQCDYEDAHALRAEHNWTAEYMRGFVDAHPITKSCGREATPGQAAEACLEQLHTGLLSGVTARLKAAEIAAA